MGRDIPKEIVKVSVRGMLAGILIIAGSIWGKSNKLTFIIDFENITIEVVLSALGVLLAISSLCLRKGFRWSYWVALIFSVALLLPWALCAIFILILWTQNPQDLFGCIFVGIFYTPIGLLALSNIRNLRLHKNFFI